ncbi:MAG: S-layer homology domain-containing protein [Clostridiales bacterium]|nr:S-layer homology domain-containing protein [Clostridiales bacterium]
MPQLDKLADLVYTIKLKMFTQKQEVFIMKRLLALTVAIFLTCGALSVSARELFDDVSDSDWAAQYIYNLTDRGIIGGYGDGTFRQFDNVQRCEYAKMLVNIAKIPIVASAVSPYTDVPASEWFFRYINSVSSYMTGFQDSDGTLFFAPEEAATREAVAVAMVKAKGLDTVQYDNPDGYLAERFSDWEDISAFNRAYICAAVDNGIFTGDENGTFRPGDPIIRAEIVAVLYKAFPDENNVQPNVR